VIFCCTLLHTLVKIRSPLIFNFFLEHFITDKVNTGSTLGNTYI